MPYLPVRTYTIRLARPMGIKDCDVFIRFVDKVTHNGREVLRFESVNDGTNCQVTLQIRGFSHGAMGPHRLIRNVELKFPDVMVVYVIREKAAK